jgi:hypothetical protein
VALWPREGVAPALEASEASAPPSEEAWAASWEGVPSGPVSPLVLPVPSPPPSGEPSVREPSGREPSRPWSGRCGRRWRPRTRALPPEASPAEGTLRVLVRPFGDVYVGGALHGRGTNAPVAVRLAPGRHTVRVEHPSFGVAERTVTLGAGATEEVLFELDRPAALTVVSDPVHAAIYLNGEPTGRYTPAELSVPAGAHTVEVRRDGYAPARQSARMEPGGRRTLSLSLSPSP